MISGTRAAPPQRGATLRQLQVFDFVLILASSEDILEYDVDYKYLYFLPPAKLTTRAIPAQYTACVGRKETAQPVLRRVT